MNYEPMLWLIPHQYGIRPRDGKWVDKRTEKINLPKVKIVNSNNGSLVYTEDTRSLFYVRGGLGNNILKEI